MAVHRYLAWLYLRDGDQAFIVGSRRHGIEHYALAVTKSDGTHEHTGCYWNKQDAYNALIAEGYRPYVWQPNNQHVVVANPH